MTDIWYVTSSPPAARGMTLVTPFESEDEAVCFARELRHSASVLNKGGEEVHFFDKTNGKDIDL